MSVCCARVLLPSQTCMVCMSCGLLCAVCALLCGKLKYKERLWGRLCDLVAVEGAECDLVLRGVAAGCDLVSKEGEECVSAEESVVACCRDQADMKGRDCSLLIAAVACDTSDDTTAVCAAAVAVAVGFGAAFGSAETAAAGAVVCAGSRLQSKYSSK